MTADLPDRALELRSLVTSQGVLELSLHDVPVPTRATNQVLVQVERHRSTRLIWVCSSPPRT
jgi:NADPH2:quinone reductase